MRRHFFCFSHIPKTAGSTFSSILQRNFGHAYMRLSHGFFEPPLPRENIRWRLKEGTHVGCVSGHQVTCDLPYDFEDRSVVGLCIIRNPEDRTLSEFFYAQKLKRNNVAGKSRNLEEFLEEIDQRETSFYSNTQSRQLAIPLDRATSLISAKQLFLIPQDEFDLALLCLSELYPSHFTDISYVFKNVNTKRDRLIQIPPEFIHKHLKQDVELYRFCKQQFAQISAQLFTTEQKQAKLHELKRNCAFRSRIKEPISSIAQKISRAIARW